MRSKNGLAIQTVVVGILAGYIGGVLGIIGYITSLIFLKYIGFFDVANLEQLIDSIDNNDTNEETIKELYEKLGKKDFKQKPNIEVSYVSKERIENSDIDGVETIPRYLVLSNDTVFEYSRFTKIKDDGSLETPIQANEILLQSGLIYKDAEISFADFVLLQYEYILDEQEENNE